MNDFNDHMKRGRKPGRTAPTAQLLSEARQLKHNGWSYSRIAKHFSVTRQWIQQLLRIPKNQLAPKCEHCGNTGTLHGHHLDYLTDQFQTLCNSCHIMAHRSNHPKQDKLIKKERMYVNSSKNPINLLEQAALTVLKNVLEQLLWNKRQTAFALGISRVTLDKWIKKHNLQRPTV